jgi:hypothetical protein
MGWLQIWENAMEEEQEVKRNTVWGPHHRIVYATSFGLRITNNEVFIDLGTEQNLDGQEVNLSETQLILSHQGAKVLQTILTRGLDAIAELTGQEITLPPAKAEQLERTMKEPARKRK